MFFLLLLFCQVLTRVDLFGRSLSLVPLNRSLFSVASAIRPPTRFSTMQLCRLIQPGQKQWCALSAFAVHSSCSVRLRFFLWHVLGVCHLRACLRYSVFNGMNARRKQWMPSVARRRHTEKQEHKWSVHLIEFRGFLVQLDFAV